MLPLTLLNTTTKIENRFEILKVSPLDQLLMQQVLQWLEKQEKESNTWIQLTTVKVILEIDPQVVRNGCLHMLNTRKEKWASPIIRIITDKTTSETSPTISKILLIKMTINPRIPFQIIFKMKVEVKKTKMPNHQEITSKDHKEQKATSEEALITDQTKEEMSTDHL